MTSALTMNLDRTGIRDRLLGRTPARAMMLGDSLYTETVVEKRLYTNAMRMWKPDTWGGFFIQHGRLGGSVPDPFNINHNSNTTGVGVDPLFTGAGDNDLTPGGTYSGTGSQRIEITIDAEGTPDTFAWTTNGAGGATGVAITGSAQALVDGITVAFVGTDNHTAGDSWVFYAEEEPGDTVAPNDNLTQGTPYPRPINAEGVVLPMQHYAKRMVGDRGNNSTFAHNFTHMYNPGSTENAAPTGTYRTNPFEGRSVSTQMFCLANPEGPTVKLRGRWSDAAESVQFSFYSDDVDLSTASGLEIKTVGPVLIDSGTVRPTEWDYVGHNLVLSGEDQDNTLFIGLYDHIYATDGEGLHLGCMAYSGLRSDEWLVQMEVDQFKDFALKAKIDTWIIGFGTNDAGNDRTKAQFKADTIRIIERCKLATQYGIANVGDGSISAPKFLLVPPYNHGDADKRALLEQFAEALAEIASERPYECAFINMFELMPSDLYLDHGTTHTEMIEDGIHPNIMGGMIFQHVLYSHILNERNGDGDALYNNPYPNRLMGR